jgi:hypothetical protein
MPVKRQTMLHQLALPYYHTVLHDENYAYCANRACSAVYISVSSASNVFHIKSLRQHDAFPMLCYCFDVSELTYRSALKDGTAASIKSFVIEQTQQGLCACTVRNPSGRCCLADFKKLENEG